MRKGRIKGVKGPMVQAKRLSHRVLRNTRFFRYLFTYKALSMIYQLVSESKRQGTMYERKVSADDLYNSTLQELGSQGLEYDWDQDGTIDSDTSEERVRVSSIIIGRG